MSREADSDARTLAAVGQATASAAMASGLEPAMNQLVIPRWGLWVMFLASLVGSVLLAFQLGVIGGG